MNSQATTKQIENTKFVLNLILSTTLKNMACIQKHQNWDLFWKAEAGWAKLPSCCIDTSCLKRF